MTARCTLFLPARAGLTRKRLEGLVGKQATVEGARGAFVLSYPTFSVALSAVPAGEVAGRLLQSQLVLVRMSSRGVDEKLQAVLDRMQQTQAILDVTVEPGHDRAGLSRQAVQGLATQFDALWLDGHMLHDQGGDLLHSPSGPMPPATGPGPTGGQPR